MKEICKPVYCIKTVRQGKGLLLKVRLLKGFKNVEIGSNKVFLGRKGAKTFKTSKELNSLIADSSITI